LRITLLGSGSSGNVAYLEAGPVDARTRVLVDAGLPKAEIIARLERVGVTLSQIDAVLVTHDHNDHAGCAAKLGRPIWATAGTRRACEFDAELVRAGDRFRVGAFEVLPVLLPHDAVETVGYVLSDGKCRAGVLTDCGHDAPEVAAGFAGCDVLVLEANHDATLLKYGPYPPSLKRRVGGRLGHLSNDQSASLLRMIMQRGPAPKLVIGAHLSQPNNRPELAKRALVRALGRAGRVILAHHERGTPTITVEDGKLRVDPERNEQLAFDFPVVPASIEATGATS
jgi:phosphoribosyl 1,2-cyclic phosphodiesterase